MRRVLSFAAILAGFLQIGASSTIAQSQDGPLKYLTSSFVTGDVVVGGTSLFRKGVNGVATQNIAISGVPAGAEILAAYLYVQTTVRESAGEDAGIAGASFKGFALNTPGSGGGPIAKALNWADGTQACWSYGWNPRRRLVTYRADVLRFLEIDPVTGKHIANGNHVVQVADAGRVGLANDDVEDSPTMSAPRAVGASLVLIYRSADPAAALRSIVIYDGGVTKRSFETLTQRIQGFYQAAANPDARMTHIVGDGQRLFSERVQFGALTYAANPYIGRLGARWDNPTFSLATALKPYPDASNQNRLTVQPQGLLSDCLSWSAIVVSTKVQDSDDDGLLDLWESSTSEITDPTGQALPRLQQMGADPQHKDLFVEIGYLKTDGPVIYGTGVDAKEKPAHSHLPPLGALKQVAAAFKDAPVTNPNGVPGIDVHFDVGDNYQSDPGDSSAPNGVPAYILPAALALGGRSISETAACQGPGDTIIECPQVPSPGRYLMPGQYPDYPGTVGWKTGFRFYRDEILGFSRARKDTFRYALFVHALGIPREENEFLPGTTTPNPAFHIPRTNTGVADWAGGDHLVALGAFDDAAGLPVGTPFMQASTLMHEWGHNFGRRHGGDLFEPNCKPQYLSVMNYLYQLRGLLDGDAVPRLDYNRGDSAVSLDENGLTDALIDGLRFRLGWYAPKATSYLKNQLGGTATKHCDGSPLLPTDVEMVRVDATGLSDPIDWNADTQPGAGPQDINFDGVLTAFAPGANDWAKLRLNQLGARRSIGGLFLDRQNRPTVGPLSLSAGKGDLGKGDLGKGDLGKGDLGKGDLGKGDLGKGDLGKGDLGTGIISITLGKGDLGKGDLGGGDLDVGSGVPGAADQFEALELDFETAAATTGGNPTPPSAVQACLTDDGQCAPEGGDRPVRLNWLAPNVGEVDEYLVYRFVVAQPFEPPAAIVGTDLIADGVTATTFLDNEAPAGTSLAYVVVARFTDGRDSGISNFATVATPAGEAIPAIVAFTGPNVSAIHDGAQKPVQVTTTVGGTPATLAVSVAYGPPPGSTTAPSAYGAYFVQATVTEPGYTGTASIVQTIASTGRAGGTGGGPANSFCDPGAVARGLRPSTNGYYGLLGYQLLCNAGDSPARVAGPLNPSYGHTVYTEADAVCGPGEVMVGVHGTFADVFFPSFRVLQTIGPRCQMPGSDVFHDVGPVGGGTNPGTAFSLQCDYPHAVRAVVGGVGEVADGVALVCAALPALPTVTSVSPAVGKPGEGFLVVRGTTLPAVAGSSAVVRSGETTGTGFIYVSPSTPSAYFVRLPSGFPLGPATIEIQNGATSSTAFPITVASTPGTPVITNVYDASLVATTQVVPGTTVHVAADGIDTLGAVVRFQQGEAFEEVPASSALSNGAIGLVVAVTVPSLVPGSVDVSVRQGASAFSTPVVLTVPFP